MNYKKYLILFISIFILIACKRLPVDEIQTKVDKKIYYDALYLMNEKFEKSTPNNEELERYQKIYNAGKKYYLSKNDLKKAYGMDKLYLELPNRIKEKLPKIQVDDNKHKEDAKVIGSKQYEKAKTMKENTFREKVAKYLEYEKVICYDDTMIDIAKAEKKRLEAKIEKSIDYKIIGGNDELLNSMIAENYKGYIEHNPFFKTKDNPETILEITAKLIEYTPNKIEEKKNINDYDEIYTDENGKEVTNIVKYLKTHFFKSSNMKVEVKYKLTSTLTGEVILQGNKTLEHEEYTYWDSYKVISGTLKDKNEFYRFYSDEIEKSLSSKESFYREMAIKILREINYELQELPDYDIWKIYIS